MSFGLINWAYLQRFTRVRTRECKQTDRRTGSNKQFHHCLKVLEKDLLKLSVEDAPKLKNYLASKEYITHI